MAAINLSLLVLVEAGGGSSLGNERIEASELNRTVHSAAICPELLDVSARLRVERQLLDGGLGAWVGWSAAMSSLQMGGSFGERETSCC